MIPPLHPDIAVLEPLLGTWAGRGKGSYPTIESFEYLEEITFGHVGKPFLAYGQRTRHADDNRPLHAETGYWRCHTAGGQDVVEVVLAHPTGIVEVQQGPFDGRVFDLASVQLGATPTAKNVTQVVRRFELVGDELRYTVAMAAVGQPLTHHLEAVLLRQASAAQ